MVSRSRLISLYWRRRETLRAIGKRYGVSATTIWDWMRQLKVQRRSRSVALMNRYNPRSPFRIRPLSSEMDFLRCAGAVLYWCEGTHRDKRGRRVTTLAFTNADQDALKVWLRFLRNVCHLREDKIRVRLYLHQDQNPKRLLRYWSALLRVPPRQFEHVTFTASSLSRSKRNHADYHGTVKIKVHSLALVQQVQQWALEVQQRLLGDGTQSGSRSRMRPVTPSRWPG